ncbi:lysoplasmalogenase [Leptospira sp. GIMC2001]|uniref:lysoplasmalogenase n=1 Tax=Leptospira sp. GIMC2001 TaxID=1513297 RepID=UPI00234A4BB3|nr:lysoplasmalogenase [Leptospira sp. GIMC2001]WCL50303.1 lysoplasmalogenase [Leptospira sp. GIMC2001]
MNAKNVLNLLFPFLCLVYLVSLQFEPYQGQPYIKALPILVLAILVLSKFKTGIPYLLFGIGLVFSSAGDVVLAHSFPHSFTIGLGLFLVAHLFYVSSFYKRNRHSFAMRRAQVAVVLFFAFIMCLLLLPRTGEMTIPVTVYLLTIATMAVFASVQKEGALPIFLGAVFFMISDGIIAYSKFIDPIPQSHLLIMTTYYLAQGLLARGVLGVGLKS